MLYLAVVATRTFLIIAVSITLLLGTSACKNTTYDNRNDEVKEKYSIDTYERMKKQIEKFICDSTGCVNCILVDTVFLDVVDHLSSIYTLHGNKTNEVKGIIKGSIVALPIDGEEGYALIFFRIINDKVFHIGGVQKNDYIFYKNHSKLLAFSELQFMEDRDEFVFCYIYDVKENDILIIDTVEISDQLYNKLKNPENTPQETEKYFINLLETEKQKGIPPRK